MKSNFNLKGGWLPHSTVWGSVLVLTLLGGALVQWETGCKEQTPLSSGFPLPYPTPVSANNYEMVCDFESNTPTAINPYLFDLSNPPAYTLLNPGSVFSWGGASVSIYNSGPVSGGANGTRTSYGCNGSVTDFGNGLYPSFNLLAQFKSGVADYNMTPFTGIQYYLKVESDDTAPWRVLEIPLSSTIPVTAGGSCLNNCYDNFYVGFGNTDGAWTRVVHAFGDFKRQGFGNPLTPSNLTGTNLQQAFCLQWEEGNQNTPGTITFDFNVDEIQFY